MLIDEAYRYRIEDVDRAYFHRLIEADHPLRQFLEVVDWEAIEGVLAGFYSPDRGQPAIKPVIMLKLLFLQHLYNLSDRQVIERAKVDVSFRYFLQVGLYFSMPHPSLLCRFRGRLSVRGFQNTFQSLISTAREMGLVKDRLRLKDASHVLANIAVPTTLELVAQIRDKLVSAAEPFDPEGAEGHRLQTALVRAQTNGQDTAEQLLARVAHLKDILDWLEQIDAPEDADQNRQWKHLLNLKELGHKILRDQENPDADRRTRSIVDPEARRGKHGDWFDGYKLDVLMDADSELVTEINVLEAGGDEAQDAIELIRREETAQGNDIEALSMDGAGFNGPMLRELEDPEGLAVTTYVPPKKEPSTELFSAEDFQLADDESHVTCPAGEQSRYRQKDRKNSLIFRFAQSQCADCPLVRQCLGETTTKKHFGKIVRKNRYEAEYQRVRQRATTDQYARVRKEHPTVERKLNELLNHHRGRVARYWGAAKILCQQLMIAFVVNVKRIITILRARRAANG